jgi:cysteine desulfurase
MKLSSKARYAVMAMVDIAHYGEADPVSLSAISTRQGLPLAYLEQLFNRLKKATLVVSCRGSSGGYKLSRPRQEVRIYDVIAAVEPPMKATRCADHGTIDGATGCQGVSGRCMTHDLWGEFSSVVEGFLQHVTLEDVCSKRVRGLSNDLFTSTQNHGLIRHSHESSPSQDPLSHSRASQKQQTTHIYLDHNATAPLDPVVHTAVIEALGTLGNASSVHTPGRTVRALLEQARSRVADFFAVKPSQVVFTSGATEANMMLLKGWPGSLITSTIEHDSVLEANPSARRCRVDSQGILDLEHLEDLLKHSPSPVLVSVMAANNETGVIQPLEKIAEVCRRYGAKLHSDAAQAVGKIQLNWQQLQLDFISVSGHKLGALQGVGALILNEKIPLQPLIRGGGQERSHRSGTENSIGIISLGTAIEEGVQQDWEPVRHLRDDLETRFLDLCPEGMIFGQGAPRLPNTSCLATPGISSPTQVMYFDLKGISVSAGSACSSGKVKTSLVLKAMGVMEPMLENSLRVSLGPSTTRQDIDRFIEVWRDLFYSTNPKLSSFELPSSSWLSTDKTQTLIPERRIS